MTKQSRRRFVIRSAMGLSSSWLALNWSGILDARAYAMQKTAGQGSGFQFFTREQAAAIDAMASQIIPTDDTPGAHEARCVYFIDRSLTTFLRESQPIYTTGLGDLQTKTRELFPDASRFSSLTSAQQIQVLIAIEHSEFFATVRRHTITGMLASPVHGGNYDEAGWKLIGFEDKLNFKPPFGYYDAKSESSS